MTKKPEPRLWLSDSLGQYIPYTFTTTLDRARVAEVDDEDWAILEAGPDHEQYWDAWAEVERKALITLDDGVYTVLQSSDVWLIPVGMRWSTATDWFVWPDEAKEQDDD